MPRSVSCTLGLAALLLALRPITLAAQELPAECRAGGSLVDVQVLVGGRATPLFTAPGRFDRRYFQASKGRNYSLVMQNNTGARVGVLIAVDGLNVVNGERSALSPYEPMYVLDPWERAEIQGWRTSLDDVRRFVFVDEQRSYAERSGKANADMGWIRVLTFTELNPPVCKIQPVPGEMREEQGSLDGRPCAPSAPLAKEKDQAAAGSTQSDLKTESNRENRSDESNPGTGWGDRRHDPVQRTWFNPAPDATDRILLRYEYESGLLALGIDLHPHHDRLWAREQGNLGFAQAPPR